jgi:hypothetical protein
MKRAIGKRRYGVNAKWSPEMLDHKFTKNFVQSRISKILCDHRIVCVSNCNEVTLCKMK